MPENYDLDQYLTAREASETAAERQRAFADEYGDADVPREARRLVDESDVSDPDVPVFHGRYGSNDSGRWS